MIFISNSKEFVKYTSLQESFEPTPFVIRLDRTPARGRGRRGPDATLHPGPPPGHFPAPDGHFDSQSDGQIDGQIITSRDATEMAPIPTMSPTASRGPASGQGAAEPFLAVEGASFAVWSPS